MSLPHRISSGHGSMSIISRGRRYSGQSIFGPVVCNMWYQQTTPLSWMISSFVSYSMLYALLCSCLLCSYGRHTLYRLLPFWVYFCTRSDTLLVPAIRAVNRANWLPSINPNIRVIFLQIFPIRLPYWILLPLSVFPKYKYYPAHNAWFDKVLPN